MTTESEQGTTTIEVKLAAYAEHRDRVAITHSQGEWTFGELLDRIYRMARALRAQGLRRGDVIALLTRNRPETFVLRDAANLLGCCVTILQDDQATPVTVEMLRTTGAAALVFVAERDADQARAVVERVPGTVLLAVQPCPGILNLTAAESADPLPVEARPDDLSSIRLTGGSSGTPKGIPHDSRTPSHFSPTSLVSWKNTTQLLCTHVGHLGGTLAEVIVAAGGRVVLHESFHAGDVLATIQRERITFVWLLPTLLHQVLDHAGLAETDTSSLRTLMLGGAASTPHRVAEAIERFGPIVMQGYGTFECGQITILSAEEHARPELLTTVGRPVPSVTVSIRDTSGEPMGTNATGEIWIHGRSMMTGYHRQPEETARVLRDGWFHTGDLGFMDDDGYLSVVGRSKDVILAKSARVYPARIEEVLLGHPRIQAAVVFGMTFGDNDERVCAAVVPTPTGSLSKDDVIRTVHDERGAAFAPEVVLVLDELPTTGSQKPDRNALRSIVESQH